eukprot:GHVL01030708.1.p1 GENE.GHVL01030708.1~~GHVL01030708.1.p1  ORF type:complete len:324 (+),score=67.67 GHVL01030708.1:861-1832(+)
MWSQMSQGQHFMDILPTLSEIIRKVIPTAPTRQKVCFSMNKGGVMDFGTSSRGQVMMCGLGWDTTMGEMDLDTSAVLMDQNGNVVEAVFFSNLKATCARITHSGDNTTGDGTGDDEQITLELSTVPDTVAMIFLLITIYTPNRTFTNVANPYCRVVETSTGQELCRYKLQDAGAFNSVIIGRFAKAPRSGGWGFHALGVPANGRTWKDCVPEMSKLLRVNTNQLASQQTMAPPSTGTTIVTVGNSMGQSQPGNFANQQIPPPPPHYMPGNPPQGQQFLPPPPPPPPPQQQQNVPAYAQTGGNYPVSQMPPKKKRINVAILCRI